MQTESNQDIPGYSEILKEAQAELASQEAFLAKLEALKENLSDKGFGPVQLQLLVDAWKHNIGNIRAFIEKIQQEVSSDPEI